MLRGEPPSYLSTFVGRDRELAELSNLFESRNARLVTVVGPPGIGKTRLAARYVEGSVKPWLFPQAFPSLYVCDLARSQTSQEALWNLGQSLRIEGYEPEELSAGLLHKGPTFLVIDTVEHLIPEISPRLSALCQQTPALRMLVTSREPLRVDGEIIYRLGPLNLASDQPHKLSEGARLFIERAQEVSGTQEVGQLTSHEACEQIARTLEGIPLAIELAARRVHLLGHQNLYDKLQEDGLKALGKGRRDGPAHHSTLGAAIDWSWKILGEDERAALAQCSVFPGDFKIEGAEKIIGTHGKESLSPVQILDRLVDCSMIEIRGLHKGKEPLFRLARFIREFAQQHLDGRHKIEARHTDYVVEASRKYVHQLRQGPVTEALDELDLLRDDLRVVAQRNLKPPLIGSKKLTRAIDAILALDTATIKLGAHPAHKTLLDKAIDSATDEVDKSRQARLRWARARLVKWSGDVAAALKELDQALEFAKDSGDRAAEAMILSEMAIIRIRAGELDQAKKHTEEALEAAHQSNDLRAQAISSGSVALHQFAALGVEAAKPHMEKAIELAQRIADLSLEAEGYGILANWTHAAGHLEEARRMYQNAIRSLKETGDLALESIFTGYFATVELERGEYESALETFETLDELFGRAPTARHEALFNAFYASALVDRGHRDSAVTRLNLTRKIAETIHDLPLRRVISLSECHLALARARTELAAGHQAKAQKIAEDLRLEIQDLDADDDVTIAQRILARKLSILDGELKSTEAVEIEATGEWFQCPGCERVFLKRRQALKKVLLSLAKARRDAPGHGVSWKTLFEAGWPDVQTPPESGKHRVRVAIYTLRQLGLTDHILTKNNKYFIRLITPVRLI